MGEFGQIQDEFSEFADFLVVYIEEAHPVGGWKFDIDQAYHTHKSAHDRIREAKGLSKQIPWAQVVADNMDNDANVAYGALPERLYIVQNGIVVYEGDVGPRGYNLEEVRDWLERYRLRENNN